MSKVAVVISGGGQKGPYAVGVLKRLILEMDLTVSIYAGVSVGALISALMAQYPEDEKVAGFQHLTEVFLTVKTEDVHESWAWRWLGRWLGYLWAFVTGKPSLRSTAPLRGLIAKHLDTERLMKSDKQCLVGSVSLTSGGYWIFSKQFVPFAKAVEASASFPFIFEPVEMRGEIWTDGGIRTVTPLKAAIDAGAEVVYSITLSPEDPPDSFTSQPDLLECGLRVLDLQGEEIVLTDLQVAKMYNAAILLTERLKEAGVPDEDVASTLTKAGLPQDIANKRYVEITEFRPSRPLDTSLLEFVPSEAREIYEIGYRDALAVTGG